MGKDIKQEITDRIIQALEQGIVPWKAPFERASLPVNFKTKHKYRGVNAFMLWLTAYFKGYTSNYWLGYYQAKALGGYVRKKESGTAIIVYNSSKKLVPNKETGEDEEITTRFFKSDYVFNLDQIDGLKIQKENPDIEPIESLESLVGNTGVIIRHQGERAYFDIQEDFINMPYKSKFSDKEGYYSTLSHELTHWTGHTNRLNRFNIKNKEDRAFEELVAEIGSSFLCSEYGISPDIQNSASYINSWLQNLKQDKGYIFKAASKANEAVTFIKSFETLKDEAQVA